MKIRVLIVAKDLQLHGISKVIMNYYRYIDSSKIQMDFAVGEPIDPTFETEIITNGSHLFRLPDKSENGMGYYAELFQVVKKNQYDILHVHGNSALISIELLIGKINGIPVRIAHSHNSTCNHVKLHQLLQPIMPLCYTHGFACSQLAGDWMFGKHSYEIIENGFDTRRFVFDAEKRKQYRKSLNIDGNDVLGHIGFFNEQKNHRFLVDVFALVHEQQRNTKLLLIGDGYKKQEICQYVEDRGLTDSVIFYGQTNDVPGLLSAMDCFVFPSLFEGLGIALLEAQINGLPCVLSDVIPMETKLGSRYTRLSLDDHFSLWASKICESMNSDYDRNSFYEENDTAIQRFDIKESANRLNDFYLRYTDDLRRR